MKNKGYVVILDALVALIIALLMLTTLTKLHEPTASKSSATFFRSLHYMSEDVMDVLNKQGVLDEIGTKWAAANGSITSGHWLNATNISRGYLDKLIPERFGYRLVIDDTDVLYDSDSDPDSIRPPDATALSRTHSTRLLVGYGSGLPVRGHVARAFLTNIRGKTTSRYAYFGGFVGQGNITRIITLPKSLDTVERAYIELDISSAFGVYINNQSITSLYDLEIGDISTPFSPGAGNMTANIKAYIPDPENYFISGDNRINIKFTGNDLSGQYIGGGFIKVTYNTSEMDTAPETEAGYYYFPGIDGLINLYSSIYVPGTLDSMEAYLHFFNNYTTYLTLGNAIIFTDSGNDSDQTVAIQNDEIINKLNLAGLTYSDLSRETIPLRMGTGNISYTIGTGNADVILITDVSGSMEWRLDSNVWTSKVITDCDDPLLYDPDTRRISLAKCLDKEFVNILLNTTGNRVGLVSFDTVAEADGGTPHPLSNDNNSLINNINTYPDDPEGGTCVCCAINKAYDLLSAANQTLNLIHRQSDWLYNDSYRNSTPPNDPEGDSWIDVDYADSGWSTGKAPYMLSGSGGGNRVAVMGDYNNQLKNLLEGYGYQVTQYSYNDYNGVISDLDNIDAVILHKASNNANFNNLLTKADNKRKGLIFASSYPYSGYGLGVLRSRTGDPGHVTHKWGYGPVKIKILQDHPIFDGYSKDQIITIINGGDNDYQTYTGYTGTNIASSEMPKGYLHMIGYREIPGGARHVVMGSFGATGWTNVNDWTTDGKNIFNNAVRWAIGEQVALTGSFYFRTHFTVLNPEEITSARLYVLSDDKAEIYLNGNLIDNDTSIHNGTYWNREINVDASNFITGDNVIAAKLYNNDNVSAMFDLELSVNFGLRKGYIIVMTDGITGFHCGGCGYTPPCSCTGSCTDTDCDWPCLDCGGNPWHCWGTDCDTAINDAICSSCRAHNDLEATVYSIGFGSVSTDCPNANRTMQGIANCGNGSYYGSSNATELMEIYQYIAGGIVNATYKAQVINITGDVTASVLYPDSYIKFSYTPIDTTDYGEITLTRDTERFNDAENCIGFLFVPEIARVVDAKVTSYSSEHWTDYLIVNNQTPPVYTLRDKYDDYFIIGDPYIVQIPPTLINSGENNSILLDTGDGPDPPYTGCSPDNKVIYTLRLNGRVSYGDVFLEKNGCKWTIQFEDNTKITEIIPDYYNGTQECSYTSGNISYDMNDAVDDAIFRLLQRLDSNENNKIDIKFDSSMIEFDFSRAGGVRSLWGPITMKLIVWI